MRNSVTWEIEVQADSESEAYEITKNWGREEMQDSEETNNCWDIEIWEAAPAIITDCPEHEGGYDCTPFCSTCEGNQFTYANHPKGN